MMLVELPMPAGRLFHACDNLTCSPNFALYM